MSDNSALKNITRQLLKKVLVFKEETFEYLSLGILFKELPILNKLPFSMRVVLENLVRKAKDDDQLRSSIEKVLGWLNGKKNQEIDFYPARVLLQDFTGVPVVVDLAAMRDGAIALNGDPKKVNPLIRADLVIDHSVIANDYGNRKALEHNIEDEYEQNLERYRFLKWGQKAFENFKVVPPGMGICHQVNLEYLADVITFDKKAKTVYPDTVIGTDSHTTMVNGLGVLGWGVGGIEAEAVMLGESISMILPEVVGFKLTGKLNPGVTATDLVLFVTEILRKKKVVGKFVEFSGKGLETLTLPDRATIANMAPEYGATCGFFSIDGKTLDYLHLTGRSESAVESIEYYAKSEMLWNNHEEIQFSELVELDLGCVIPSMSGPKRPQDRCNLDDAYDKMVEGFFELPPTKKNPEFQDPSGELQTAEPHLEHHVEGYDFKLRHGDVVLASITSCTNTSNPSVLIAAGLVAKKAIKLGLHQKPWVKTSLAPGSRVVTKYLEESGLQKYLDELGFNVVGYGCTTCIGNSGPLKSEIEETIVDNDLCVAGVLSGNRNFEGRIHPFIKANYLASPPLVVAFALAGTLNLKMSSDVIGIGFEGKEVRLKDIWPTEEEINEIAKEFVKKEFFEKNYETIFDGEKKWQEIDLEGSETYSWNNLSTYIKNPPYFENFGNSVVLSNLRNINNARILGLFGDSITTDHISPAGNIKETSPAGVYLKSKGIDKDNFNSYGSRRGNHDVMVRGTFANVRLKNEIVTPLVGGFTYHYPDKTEMSIFDAAMLYKSEGIPLVIFAGKEYGSGSSRDWAAKGTNLLGVKAVIAESFERIHRSNLVGMGVIPLTFKEGETREGIEGDDVIDIIDLDKITKPKQIVRCVIKKADGSQKIVELLARIDTEVELETLLAGGVLQKVLRKLIGK
jgi:aconitate hydratase